ncbi:hypothetical protein BC826DRAFT_246526 [Russula brevipes]|nr:hypothetical protein BC826DRAFT_246526 [Russula brevipes]
MPSLSDKFLCDLLRQPFGPYLEETILSDKCKFVPSKRLLLNDFQLAYNDEPTGFDRTEFDGDYTPVNVKHLAPIPSGSRVLFRGTLLIHSLSHLSEKGLQYLNHDFRMRIKRSAMNGVLSAGKYASLDVESIFSLRAKQKNNSEDQKHGIHVLVQGYMHSTASFLRSDLAPNGLLIHTANAAKNRFRNYQIVSMDVETYKLSRTFLFRHHTLKAMRDILKTADPGMLSQKCTPLWCLEQYLLHCAYPPHSRWQRSNFLRDVESSDEGSSKHWGHPSVHPPPDAQTHRPRYLRTVHRNEVWSVFASHSEWILSIVEKHKDLKGKVNAQLWRIFLLQVPQLRGSSTYYDETNEKWGLRDEQEANQIGKATKPRISSYSTSKAILQSTTPRNQKSKKKDVSTKPVIQAVIPPTHGFRASSSMTPITISQAEDQYENVYDSDFTQGSPSPTLCHATPCFSSTVHAHSPSSFDPSLFALIPSEMYVPPILPADMLWHCPVGGGTCSYFINLCNLQMKPSGSSRDCPSS